MDTFNSPNTVYTLSYGMKNVSEIIYDGEDNTEYMRHIYTFMKLWETDYNDVLYLELYNDGKKYNIYKPT